MSLCKKIEFLSTILLDYENPELLYQKIIELGSKLPPMDNKKKIDSNKVIGCQSNTFLLVSLKNDKILIEADSDALISRGLCSIFYLVYNNVEPIKILKHEPSFLKNLNIMQNLSPNRSNGLIQILNKIKKDTLRVYMQANHQ